MLLSQPVENQRISLIASCGTALKVLNEKLKKKIPKEIKVLVGSVCTHADCCLSSCAHSVVILYRITTVLYIILDLEIIEIILCLRLMSGLYLSKQ